MLFAALTPLLPHFAESLHLSKTGAGVLVASYAAGALVGGLPGGAAAARLGSRRAVLVGLTLMGLASLGFAFAHGFWALAGARFLQGCGSAFTWAGAFAWLLAATPRARRGEMIGSAMGAAVFGALFGPAVGAAAAIAGRAPVFSALAGLAVVLGAATFLIEPVPPDRPSAAAMARALRNRVFIGGLALMALPALLFGVLSTLAPLHLSAAGWGAAAIGAVWLVGAAIRNGALTAHRTLPRPAWRIHPDPDRARCRSRGLGRPRARAAARSSTCRSSSSPRAAYGVLFTPAFALIADGAERSRLRKEWRSG